jgi:recombination DNA repair RAD52 pathway protein
VILGTFLLVLVIGVGVVGVWKARAAAFGDGKREAVTDELLIALARDHDAARSQPDSRI